MYLKGVVVFDRYRIYTFSNYLTLIKWFGFKFLIENLNYRVKLMVWSFIYVKYRWYSNISYYILIFNGKFLKVGYEEVLEMICENHNLNPLTIMTDYETALVNAFKKQFPNSEMRWEVVFFHLSQCVYRKIQSPGLKKDYESNADIKL